MQKVADQKALVNPIKLLPVNDVSTGIQQELQATDVMKVGRSTTDDTVCLFMT